MINHLLTKICVMLIVLNISFYTETYAQKAPLHAIQGKVYNGQTMEPSVSAIIIIQEAGLVGTVRQDGSYSMTVPKAGIYTINIQAQGFQPITTKITIDGIVNRDFALNTSRASGGSVTVRGERDIQRISRHTMTVKQIKETPGTFGDSINALATLPGVNRPMGIFGPLIIRGMDDNLNGYFIDDIPLLKPTHFGGIHSVINNDLMSEIDLYSSAFPAQFSNTQAAVININTIDEVTKFGGNTEIGLLSANALIKTPITGKTYSDGKEVEENKGYFIVAGRYGYLSLFIPLFYKYVLHKELSSVPQYWDAQFKAKYKLNENNSVKILAFGNKDYWKLVMPDQGDGEDPLMVKATMQEDTQSYGVGLYYEYKNGDRFTNTLLSYAAINRTDLWLNIPRSSQAWAKDFSIRSYPNIYAIKDRMRFEWIKDHAEMRAGIEYALYNYISKGKMLMMTTSNFNGNGTAEVVNIDRNVKNYLMSSYFENKFTLGGLVFVPGVHSERLDRIKKTTVDPRGMISFTFPTKTTLALAGGQYSKFIQTNLGFYDTLLGPDIISDKTLDPQRSIHRSASIEQKIDRYTCKVEGFYNNYWDYVEYAPYVDENDQWHQYLNSGKHKTYGVEFMVKAGDENDSGFFGWISYTFNKSKHKSNVNTQYIDDDPADGNPDTYYDKYGKQWLNSWSEMIHVAKAVAGYTFGRHTLSSRFQLNSSLPYTPIVDSTEDPDYAGRYVPEYGKTNSGRLPFQYQLDIRYTNKSFYKWGQFSWYIEILNVTNYRPYEYHYDWTKPKSGNNPRERRQKGGIAFLPNFGIEVRF
jgi:hypothetical protein